MSKKKYQINDRVRVEFIGSEYDATIVGQWKHDETLFRVITDSGMKIPAVGYPGNTAKFANIIETKKVESNETTI